MSGISGAPAWSRVVPADSAQNSEPRLHVLRGADAATQVCMLNALLFGGGSGGTGWAARRSRKRRRRRRKARLLEAEDDAAGAAGLLLTESTEGAERQVGHADPLLAAQTANAAAGSGPPADQRVLIKPINDDSEASELRPQMALWRPSRRCRGASES